MMRKCTRQSSSTALQTRSRVRPSISRLIVEGTRRPPQQASAQQLPLPRSTCLASVQQHRQISCRKDDTHTQKCLFLYNELFQEMIWSNHMISVPQEHTAEAVQLPHKIYSLILCVLTSINCYCCSKSTQ